MQDPKQDQEKRNSSQKHAQNSPKIQNQEVREEEVRIHPWPVGAQWRAIFFWTYPRVYWPGADATACESFFSCLRFEV